MRNKKLKMMFLLAMLVVSTTLFSACGAKKLPTPEPVLGKDISRVKQGDPAPFEGTLFSDFYLKEYLEWKCKTQGKC